MTVGQRIYNLRMERGMTQEQLSEKLEVSRQSISKWELDKALPDIQKLIEMSKLYEVTIDYIILGKEPDTMNTGDCDNSVDIGVNDNKAGVSVNGGDENSGDGSTDRGFDIIRYARVSAAFICMAIAIAALVFELHLSGDFAFNTEDRNSDMVRIDKIYEQYTKADVAGVDDAGNEYRKQVWLDTPDLKEGDWIFAYHNDDNYGQMKFEYYRKTLLVPLAVTLIAVCLSVILMMPHGK